MSDDNFYVYRIDARDGTPLYFGKGRRFRYRNIEQRSAPIKAAIKAGQTRAPVKLLQNLTEAEAHAIEVMLIAKTGRADLGKGPLLNLSDGGPGWTNPSPEARARMRARIAELLETTDLRARLSAAQRVRPPRSPETREKLAAAQRGKRMSAETKRKLLEANRGRPPNEAQRVALAKGRIAGWGRPWSEQQRRKRLEARRAQIMSELQLAALAAGRAAKRGKPLSPEARAKAVAALAMARAARWHNHDSIEER